MKPKEKKCKGTGLAAGYGCGSLQIKRVYGLGFNCGCYPEWLYNSKEGKAKIERATFKATESSRSLKKAIKEKKETKGITAQLLYTKTIVHEMVRLRDKYKQCISCNQQWNDTFQAGHYYPAGNYKSIKFNFLNINGQCRKCNLMNDGSHEEYKVLLPGRIGKENFNIIEDLARQDKKSNKYWTIEELKNIQKEARKIIKELK